MKQKFYFLCTLFWCTILSFGQTNATHLNFDGTNDFVNIGNVISSSSSYTKEAMIFTNNITGSNILSSNTSAFWFWQGNLQAGHGGGFMNVFTNASSLINSWNHVALTYDSATTTMKLYVNGVLVSQNNSVPQYTAANIQIGAFNSGSVFNGNIDDVRIWNVARTAEQISSSMNCELQGTETGLIAYYKFNQGINQANNTTLTTLTATTGTDGTLVNFALNGTTSNWLSGSPVTTGSLVPSVASVTSPVNYTQGATASALTATTGANGTSLLWYTTATGGTGSATAPTPSTASVGSTTYWVSSTNANGCESARVQIVVNVNLSATHLNFDGTNDFVNIGNVISSSSSYTKEAMIFTNNITGSNIMSSNTSAFWFWQGNLQAGHGGGFMNVFANASSLINSWNHVALTYDSATTTMKLYVNGVLVSQNNSVPQYTAANIQIGAFNSGSVFNGNIDEVRIWNVARTAEQINGSKNCELQGNETGLVAYYNFNQGLDAGNNTTITSLTDATANANNGTLTNFTLTGATSNWLAGSPITTGSVVPSVATVTTPVVRNQGDTAPTLTATTGTNGTGLLWYTTATGGTGSATAPTLSTATVGSTSYWVSSTNANGCESARVEIVFTVNALVSATHLNFDGTNDHVTIPATAINNLPQGTIETWVYLNNLNEQTICSKQSNGENSYAILAVGGGSYDQGAPIAGQVSYQSKNGSIIKSTGPLLQIGQWYHLAITFTNTQARLYINGVLNNTVNANFSLPNDLTVTATSIGAWLGDGGGQYFNGNIDEFRVWNAVLTPTEINNLKDCEAQAQPELIAYYKFNQGYDGVSNTSTTTLLDSAGSNNGTLTNFALTGATSNWKSGSPVTTGNTCTTLDNSSFEAISNLKVYPNPSTGIFNISAQENVTIEVYDLVGKQIKTQEVPVGTSTIDISNYASGVYLLKATNTKGAVNNYKLIKQ